MIGACFNQAIQIAVMSKSVLEKPLKIMPNLEYCVTTVKKYSRLANLDLEGRVGGVVFIVVSIVD